LYLIKELQRRNVFRVGAAYAVVAWLVIQVVETLFPIYGLSDASIRLVVTVLGIGLLPVVIFAWAFELTPEGFKRDSEVDHTSPVIQKMGKRWDKLIMVVLSLALGYFAFDKFVLAPQQQAEEVAIAREEGRTKALIESYGKQSIAVLPFVDMSLEGDQEYFSDGIAEELLNLLSKIPEIRVISRSSAFSYKGKDVSIPTIANQLNVAHVLEGSVRKAGNKIRISAQLIDARSDTQLWSDTYDRTLDNIFEIQDEISAVVVEQLKITLLGNTPTTKVINPEAYALYLQAKDFGRQKTAEGIERSNVLYLQSLAIEPNYPNAWGGLASNYSYQALRGWRSADEGYSLAREAAEQVLAVDPNYAPVYVTLGWIAMRDDSSLDLTAAARNFERALSLEPTNPGIFGNAASMLFSLGRIDQSIPLSEYSVARDPLSSAGFNNLAIKYLLVGRLDEAIVSARKALSLRPGYEGPHYVIGEALLFKGDLERALDSFVEEGDERLKIKGTVMALHSLGRQAEFEVVFEELKSRWGDESPSEVAHVYAWIGDAEAAFEWLDKAEAQNEPGLAGQFLQPFFSPLHTDPRWIAFRERMGVSEEKLDSIKFIVTLPE
jgi:adenylate cyclase